MNEIQQIQERVNRLKKEIKIENKKLKALGVYPKKKKKVTEELVEENCPKCSCDFTKREHAQITEKQLKRPYYFSQWLYCKSCGYMKMEEKYKVFNRAV